jgi:hypothetical protein
MFMTFFLQVRFDAINPRPLYLPFLRIFFPSELAFSILQTF